MGWKLLDLVPSLRGNLGDENSPGCIGGSSSQSPESENDREELTHPREVLPELQFRQSTQRELSSSEARPGVSDPVPDCIQEMLRKGAYTVKIKKGTKKKNLFRFLLAKLFYEKEEGLHLDEFIVLWELLLDLQEMSAQDQSFYEKYGNFFEEENHKFFEKLGRCQEFPLRVEANPDEIEKYVKRFQPLLPSRSAYFGLKGQNGIRSGFLLTFAAQLPLRKIPEGRRIGVGYRDKGSRRNLAEDGSPDWREVARNSQEEVIRSVETLTGIKRDDPTFNWEFVNNPTEFQVVRGSQQDPRPSKGISKKVGL
jgi:hypothetical protein